MQNLYNKFVEIGKGVTNRCGEQLARNSGMYLISHNMERTFKPPSANVRAQVFAAWDITPDEQIALEAHIDGYVLEFGKTAVDRHENYTPILHALSR
jgi:hypothetical protein